MKTFVLTILVATTTALSAVASPVIKAPVNPPPAPMETNAPPLVEIEIGNERSKEETHINSGATTASKMTSTMDEISKEPLWVKLIGAAVGLGLLAWVIFWAIKKIKQGAAGAAAAQAFSLADNAVAHALTAAEARLAANTDQTKTADLQAHVAELNKARGKIAQQAPPPPKA